MIILVQIGVTTFLILTAVCVVVWFVRSQKSPSGSKEELGESHRQFMASLDRLADAVGAVDLESLDVAVKQLTEGRRESPQPSSAGRPIAPFPTNLELHTNSWSGARLIYISAFFDALPPYCLYHTPSYGIARSPTPHIWVGGAEARHLGPIETKDLVDAVYQYYDVFSHGVVEAYDLVPEAEEDDPMLYYLDTDRFYEVSAEWGVFGRNTTRNALVVPHAGQRV